jgi:DNA-directed RNA polymerase subunit RPC12/RpoP
VINEVAFAVPCRTCGAPLRLDLTSFRAHCAYCRSDAAFAHEALERVQRHLAEIARLEAEAAGAAADADYQRQRRRLGWGWLQPLFPLVTGLYVILGLGIGGASQFVVDPFLTRYVGESAAGFAGGIVALSIWAAVVALPLTLRARRRRVALSRREVVVGAVACGGCGASVPVVVGRAMACPFCGAHLVASESTNRVEQALARNVVAEQRAKATVAGVEADRAGALQSEQTLGSVIPNQLMVIAFAILVSIAVGLAKLVFHF